MNHAVKILDIMESSRLKVFYVNKHIPFEEQPQCPACDTFLTEVCRLINNKRDQRIRYGLCSHCGYMGYMDRPKQSWMIDFYTVNWDRSAPATEAEIESRTILPGKGIKPSGYLAASLIHNLKLTKDSVICEVGSGYGEVLKYFKSLGFQNLVGIENSKHRADLVHKVLGFPIIQGEFENSKVQGELSRRKPIGLIFSHQVLEHVYHPQEILKHVSALQEHGGYIILAVPNAEGEHIDNAPLFLPHLHSFSKQSLEALLNKNGYEVIADNSTSSDIILAAEKVLNPKPSFKYETDYIKNVTERLKHGFAVDRIQRGKLYQLFWGWGRDRDYTEITYESPERLFSWIFWNINKLVALAKTKLLKRFASGCTMLVTYAEHEGNFFEIQFHNDIILLIK